MIIIDIDSGLRNDTNNHNNTNTNNETIGTNSE